MSNGLGDTVAAVTHFFGIDKVADAVAKLAGIEGCGCAERRAYLNILFPYDGYKRNFLILKDFVLDGTNYKQGQKVTVTKDHVLLKAIINFVRDGLIQEE
jgi:hypothetical protein